MSCSDLNCFQIDLKLSDKLENKLNVQGTDITIERNVQGKILHINLYCTTIGYHTDRTFHVMRNVQGQTHIKDNFNFVQ